MHCLEDGELYVAYGGYHDGYQWASTPTGHHNKEQRTYGLAWPCHQTVNRCFKCFGCMSMTYRHPLYWHGIIVQLAIINNEPLFHMEYDEDEFHTVCIVGRSFISCWLALSWQVWKIGMSTLFSIVHTLISIVFYFFYPVSSPPTS